MEKPNIDQSLILPFGVHRKVLREVLKRAIKADKKRVQKLIQSGELTGHAVVINKYELGIAVAELVRMLLRFNRMSIKYQNLN